MGTSVSEQPLRVSVLGGSGYIGGELVRLLLGHPRVELGQVVARQAAGSPIGSVHPNLRGVTASTFTRLEALTSADVICSALPHGSLLDLYRDLSHLAPRWIDLAADHRLRDTALRKDVYGWGDLEQEWIPGFPERHAVPLAAAERVTVPGCMATPSILALAPVVAAGLVEPPIVVDALTGSSGAGALADTSSHHAERAGAMRVYAPNGHRHQAEICQELALPTDAVRMSVTAVEPVRGVLVKVHTTLRESVELKDIRQLYARAYGRAPFIRIVALTRGRHRFPDPRWLVGSNFCDIGFALDRSGRRLLLLAAVDNLVKGGAGTAVQVINLMHGFDERDGLTFPGLHPI
jgi:N-acetyl-gamma-glutamyl-phosphate/LysW-gamma-L-alpha-aminoadipyl-6-phosphate reductase